VRALDPAGAVVVTEVRPRAAAGTGSTP